MRFCGRMLQRNTGACTGQPRVLLPTRTAATSASETFFDRPDATRTSIGGVFGNEALSVAVESFDVSRGVEARLDVSGAAAESLDISRFAAEALDVSRFAAESAVRESRLTSPCGSAPTSTGTSQRVESVRLVSARASGDRPQAASTSKLDDRIR